MSQQNLLKFYHADGCFCDHFWHLAVLISSYRHTMGLKIIGPVKTWQPKMAAEPVEEAQQIGL